MSSEQSVPVRPKPGLAARSWWVWLAVFAPLVWPTVRLVRADPRVLADPAEYLLNYSGLVALILLLAVLSLTPLRLIFDARWARDLNRHRRLIGVASWAWGTAHFVFYVLYAGGWSGVWDNFDKVFILAGALGWLILLVLAITSWRAMVRWLGGKRWKALHRWVYLAVALLLYHYAAQEKAGAQLVYWLAAPWALLQGLRIFRRLRRVRPRGVDD